MENGDLMELCAATTKAGEPCRNRARTGSTFCSRHATTGDPTKPATCRAKSKSTGGRCKNPPVPGATVCRIHGGSAPQVKAAAARRVLEALVGPALMEYRKIIERKKTPPAVRLAAIRDLLDRTGYKAPTVIDGYLSLDVIEREIARYEAEQQP